MIYAIICTDKSDGLPLRQANRPDHLDYLKSLGDAVKAGGPFMSEDGERPVGSLVVVEAENESAARAIADADPYAKAGVFANVDIRPWNWIIKNPEA